MTTVTIDGVFVAAFFAGLVALTGAVVGGYIKLRQIHKQTNSAATAQQERLDAMRGKLDKALESLHREQGAQSEKTRRRG